MKERPILFSGAMVHAILDGRKTQTRRMVKGEMLSNLGDLPHVPDWITREVPILCPYGAPGDRLWVRETWGIGSRPDPWGGYDGIEYRADEAWLEDGDDLPCHEVKTPDDVCLGDYRLGWKPSIHMPRWASRITLEVTNVCVERLQDISETDAIAEGCLPAFEDEHGIVGATPFYRYGYRLLWNGLNAARGYGWDENPWVWVVEFRRVPNAVVS